MTDPFFDNVGLTQALATVDTALQTLRQLGLDDQAQEIITAATAGYDDILNDPSRSQPYKLQQAAARYIAVITSVAAKLNAAASNASRQLQDDKAHVYGIVGLKGDYASLLSARPTGSTAPAATAPTTPNQASASSRPATGWPTTTRPTRGRHERCRSQPKPSETATANASPLPAPNWKA
jgi:hypothetical protein